MTSLFYTISILLVNNMSENKSKKFKFGSMKFSLYKLGNSPNWYYYYTIEGKKYSGSTHSSNEDTSIDFTRKHYEETQSGTRNRKSKKIMFKTICDEYSNYQVNRNLSTDYKKTINTEIKYLKECFGNRDVEELFNLKSMVEYKKWRNNYHLHHTDIICKDGRIVGKYKPVGGSSLNRSLSFFKMVLKFSQHHDILKRKTIPSIKDIKETEKIRERVFTEEEITKLCKYWKEKDIYRFYILKFMLDEGIRPKEHLKILHQDLHLDKNYLTLNDRKNVRSKRPQLNSTIPLTPEIKEIIKTLITRPDVSHLPTDPVFTDKDGKPIEIGKFNFKQSLIKCGIDPKGLCLYSTRHYWVTEKISNTHIPLPILSLILGHKSTLTLQKSYQSKIDEQKIVSQFLNNEK